MPLIQTADITQQTVMTPQVNQQVYCALDSAVMIEIWEELQQILDHKPPPIYGFSRALQAPYLEIMLRGWKVDDLSRRQASAELEDRTNAIQKKLNEMAFAVWDKPLNPRSPAQLKDFFFKAMTLPEVWLSQKGERKLSTNREALEKLEEYLYARPIVGCILQLRDIAKQRDVFDTEIDQDSRWRTSYNIAGTETGRPSSSTNAFGTGGNSQNISPPLRYVFVADASFKLCAIDQSQAEARDVGFFCGALFDDWSFLDACESGDLHSVNCRLIWPERKWSSDPKEMKAQAEEIFYRDFSFRDMAKRGGHLSNYSGTAWTMGRALKIPQALAEEFQARYLLGREANPKKGLPALQAAYPCIPRWWQWTAEQIQTKGFLVNPFGRKREFFGRAGDPATLREAIANLPQSTTSERTNLALWRIWKYMPQVQVLGQGYDSIVFQYPESANEDAIIEQALEYCRIPLFARGRQYECPCEAKIGWNWGNAVSQADVDRALAKGKKPPRLNPGGLSKWSPGKKDPRQRVSGIKRVMQSNGAGK